MPTETEALLAMNGHSSDVVDLSGPENPLNPMNLPAWRKWACAVVLGAMTFATTLSSSIFHAAVHETAREFNVAEETMELATTLYVFGFALGPLMMGPSSEVFGRKTPFFVAYVSFLISQIPTGLARDVPTILVFRFLGGVASAGPPAIVGGCLADFLPPVERGVAVAIFLATTVMGPSVGAILGACLIENSLGWRWAAWLSLIVGGVFGIIGFLVLPETYLPVLEKREAQRLRRKTQHWALHSKLDEKDIDFRSFVSRYLTRPLVMMAHEPILLLMTLYISFTFGMIYLMFVAYPVSFVQQRGYSLVSGSLPLIAICIGNLAGALSISYYTMTTIKGKVSEKGYLDPEDRLPPMIVGAGLFTIGLLWFALASSPRIKPWSQVVAGLPIGMGMQAVLLQSITYLIDIYTVNANSAISGTVIVRSIVGGTFPLFALSMYQRLGVFWASALLAICSAALAPIPILLYFFGAKLRSFSRYVPQA